MSGDIVVKSVNSRSMLKTFVHFPWTSGIYKDDPAWVPPLINEQMKLLEKLLDPVEERDKHESKIKRYKIPLLKKIQLHLLIAIIGLLQGV